MHVPVPRPDPIAATGSVHPDEFAALTRALAERGEVTLVYAPSTTTITTSSPFAGAEVAEARVNSPAGQLNQASTQSATPRAAYTLGDVVAYSGATLMGGAVLTELVTALLRVPMLVPVLGGGLAVAGLLTALAGAALDQHDRTGGAS